MRKPRPTVQLFISLSVIELLKSTCEQTGEVVSTSRSPVHPSSRHLSMEKLKKSFCSSTEANWTQQEEQACSDRAVMSNLDWSQGKATQDTQGNLLRE